jgi:Ca-activated chloride channel family protein
MNFRFAHPWWLLALLLIPLWVWAGHSPRLRTLLHFPSGAQLKALPGGWARRLAPLPPTLATLGMILLVLALARPQTGLRERRVSSETVDIMLAIDTSTSMRAIDLVEDGDNEQNRLEAVKEVASEFIEAREGDRLGLIAFAQMPYTISPLTLDRGWLQTRLAELQTGTLPDGTAVGSALAGAVNRLRDSEAASKVVVLLTDGINNAGDIDPLNAAPLAGALGIKVYTIGAGSSGLVRVPVADMFGRTVTRRVQIPIDEDTLARIAEITGGRFFRAENRDQLEEVFAEIDELERTEVELTEYTLYTEQFPWAAGAGLALLALGRLLASGRLGRVDP